MYVEYLLLLFLTSLKPLKKRWWTSIHLHAYSKKEYGTIIPCISWKSRANIAQLPRHFLIGRHQGLTVPHHSLFYIFVQWQKCCLEWAYRIFFFFYTVGFAGGARWVLLLVYLLKLRLVWLKTKNVYDAQ